MPLVICSRVSDYEVLPAKLSIQQAILLQPLTNQQVEDYLVKFGPELNTLRTAVQKDFILQELAHLPLMLNIMTLAYQSLQIAQIPQSDSLATQRQHLFNVYVQQMIARRRSGLHRYDESQIRHWLSWLAQKMIHNNQSIFLVRRMPLTWLPANIVKGLELTLRVTYLALFLTSIGLLIWSTVESYTGNINLAGYLSSLAGMFTGLGGYIMFLSWAGGLLGTPEKLWKISDRLMQHQPTIFRKGYRFVSTFLTILLFLLLITFTFSLWEGKGKQLNLPFYPPFDVISDLLRLAVIGISFYGSLDFVSYYILRFILWWNGYLPWRMVRFLDYCVDRIFLRRVGGGYIFIHRYLMEYFASLTPADIERLSNEIEAKKVQTA